MRPCIIHIFDTSNCSFGFFSFPFNKCTFTNMSSFNFQIRFWTFNLEMRTQHETQRHFVFGETIVYWNFKIENVECMCHIIMHLYNLFKFELSSFNSHFQTMTINNWRLKLQTDNWNFKIGKWVSIENFNKLRPCIQEDGTIDYSSLDEETQKHMSNFVKDQRKCYRKRENNEPTPLTDERFRLLSEAHFDFKPSETKKGKQWC